ncbi:hypothetical protein PsorP6_001137 [Peronosclerospora sorghi]|uniref:Uncharacterized protein n=1 Tax=Peronosclerospora sorghi TaxID=230839 RepID=A0ACC0WWL2_9STRA|nr:hypothetical protein PsorP6_001137 [Peronosclerospora sorghi]
MSVDNTSVKRVQYKKKPTQNNQDVEKAGKHISCICCERSNPQRRRTSCVVDVLRLLNELQLENVQDVNALPVVVRARNAVVHFADPTNWLRIQHPAVVETKLASEQLEGNVLHVAALEGSSRARDASVPIASLCREETNRFHPMKMCNFKFRFIARFQMKEDVPCIICLYVEVMATKRQRYTFVSTICIPSKLSAIPTNPPLHCLSVTNAGGTLGIEWDAPVRGTSCVASHFEAKWLPRSHAYALEGGDTKDVDTKPYPKDYCQPRLTTKKLWAGKDLKLPTHDYKKCMDEIEPLM